MLINSLFFEALNSVFGLLLVFYCLALYRSYKGGIFGKGFKYLIIASLLITLREATFLFSYITGLNILRDLLTSLTIIALAYSVLQFKDQTALLISSVKDRRMEKALGIK